MSSSCAVTGIALQDGMPVTRLYIVPTSENNVFHEKGVIHSFNHAMVAFTPFGLPVHRIVGEAVDLNQRGIQILTEYFGVGYGTILKAASDDSWINPRCDYAALEEDPKNIEALKVLTYTEIHTDVWNHLTQLKLNRKNYDNGDIIHYAEKILPLLLETVQVRRKKIDELKEKYNHSDFYSYTNYVTEQEKASLEEFDNIREKYPDNCAEYITEARVCANKLVNFNKVSDFKLKGLIFMPSTTKHNMFLELDLKPEDYEEVKAVYMYEWALDWLGKIIMPSVFSRNQGNYALQKDLAKVIIDIVNDKKGQVTGGTYNYDKDNDSDFKNKEFDLIRVKREFEGI